MGSLGRTHLSTFRGCCVGDWLRCCASSVAPVSLASLWFNPLWLPLSPRSPSSPLVCSRRFVRRRCFCVSRLLISRRYTFLALLLGLTPSFLSPATHMACFAQFLFCCAVPLVLVVGSCEWCGALGPFHLLLLGICVIACSVWLVTSVFPRLWLFPVLCYQALFLLSSYPPGSQLWRLLFSSTFWACVCVTPFCLAIDGPVAPFALATCAFTLVTAPRSMVYSLPVVFFPLCFRWALWFVPCFARRPALRLGRLVGIHTGFVFLCLAAGVLVPWLALLFRVLLSFSVLRFHVECLLSVLPSFRTLPSASICSCGIISGFPLGMVWPGRLVTRAFSFCYCGLHLRSPWLLRTGAVSMHCPFRL